VDDVLSIVSVAELYAAPVESIELQDAEFTHPGTVDYINTLLVVFVVVNRL